MYLPGDAFFGFVLGDSEIILALESDPEFCGGAGISGKPERQFCADTAQPTDKGSDAALTSSSRGMHSKIIARQRPPRPPPWITPTPYPLPFSGFAERPGKAARQTRERGGFHITSGNPGRRSCLAALGYYHIVPTGLRFGSLRSQR